MTRLDWLCTVGRKSLLLMVIACLGGATRNAGAAGVQFGINSFLGSINYSEIRGPTIVKPTATDRTNYLNAAQRLGVTTMREMFMNWAEVQPQKGGSCNFAAFDDLAQKASNRGIEITALAYPFPPWATGATPTPPDTVYTPMWQLPTRQNEQAFRNFVHTTVARYCGQTPESLPLAIPVRQWIFGNECDWTNISPDEYAYWLRAFDQEVKAVDPGATVLMMGLGNPLANSFLPSMLESPNLKGPGYPYFDVANYHAYPGANVSTVAGISQMQAVVSTCLAIHGVTAETRVMEAGSFISDPIAQVDPEIETVVHAASTGATRVYLHGLWDITQTGYSGSVLENTPSGQVPVEKPLFTAYQTLLKTIGNNEGVECISPGQYRALLPGGDFAYVLWQENGGGSINYLHGEICVTDLQGIQHEMDAAQFVVGAHPVFVTLEVPEPGSLMLLIMAALGFMSYLVGGRIRKNKGN
jgi:hypothetical protein